MREWYLRNKESISLKAKRKHLENPQIRKDRWRASHPIKPKKPSTFNRKEYVRQYYLKNKERILARQKKFNDAHKCEVKERIRKWTNENREWIKERSRIYLKSYRAKNREKERSKWKRYYERNKVELLAKKSSYNKELYKRDRDRILAVGRAYNARNKEKIKAQQKQYNKLKSAERARKNKAWRESNAEWIQKYRKENRHVEIRSASKRRALKRGATVSDLEAIRKWTARITSSPAFRCYYCDRLTSSLDVHFDHILPLSRFKLHNITNLCASCSSCNLSKGVKLPSEWIQNGQLIFDI